MRRQHAALSGLEIDYRHAAAEALVEEGAAFDAVVSLEVVEHVADLRPSSAAAVGWSDPAAAWSWRP